MRGSAPALLGGCEWKWVLPGGELIVPRASQERSDLLLFLLIQQDIGVVVPVQEVVQRFDHHCRKQVLLAVVDHEVGWVPPVAGVLSDAEVAEEVGTGVAVALQVNLQVGLGPP